MPSDIEQLIVDAVKSGKAMIGAEQTIKELKKGNIAKIVVARNYPEGEKSRIKYYAELAGAEFVEFQEDNRELGVLCQKPFGVSVLGIAKNIKKK